MVFFFWYHPQLQLYQRGYRGLTLQMKTSTEVALKHTLKQYSVIQLSEALVSQLDNHKHGHEPIYMNAINILFNNNSLPRHQECLTHHWWTVTVQIHQLRAAWGVVNETSEVSDEGVTDLRLSSVISWACALIFPLSLLVFSCTRQSMDSKTSIWYTNLQLGDSILYIAKLKHCLKCLHVILDLL